MADYLALAQPMADLEMPVIEGISEILLVLDLS
jgi:hypothetical protein